MRLDRPGWLGRDGGDDLGSSARTSEARDAPRPLWCVTGKRIWGRARCAQDGSFDHRRGLNPHPPPLPRSDRGGGRKPRAQATSSTTVYLGPYACTFGRWGGGRCVQRQSLDPSPATQAPRPFRS